MSRIPLASPSTPNTAIADLLATVESKVGAVPNFIAAMANSPAVATGYLSFSQSLATGKLTPRLCEQLALLVAETHGSSYCVAAHTALGKEVGLTEQETLDARLARASDPKEGAALAFALNVLGARGAISDADVARVRQAGYTDGEIGEIVAHTALSIFTNYFNLVAQTEIDFPPVPTVAGTWRGRDGVGHARSNRTV